MAKLEKVISPEKGWEITAKALTRLIITRMVKTSAVELGKAEGVTALLLGNEKFDEIQVKVWGKGSTKYLPLFKEMFNISVEDAIGAAKLVEVYVKLLAGPEYKIEIVESTPEKVVIRRPQCPWWNRYVELGVDLTLRGCDSGHVGWMEEGLKELNPKLTYRLTKTLPWGDPICEEVIECKEE